MAVLLLTPRRDSGLHDSNRLWPGVCAEYAALSDCVTSAASFLEEDPDNNFMSLTIKNFLK